MKFISFIKIVFITIIINSFNSALTALTLQPELRSPSGFSLSLTGYYLQASASDNDLKLTNRPPANVILKPQADWSGKIQLEYLLPNSATDIGLQYSYLSNSMKNYLVVPETIEDIDAPIIATIDLRGKFEINQLDLTTGYYINLFQNLSLHPFVGIRIAEIQQQLSAFETITTAADDSDIKIFGEGTRVQTSEFTGVGPLIGMDMNYALNNEFSIEANADTALLTGNMVSQENNSQTLFVEFPDMIIGGTASTQTNTKNRREVPVFDMSLALDYTYKLRSENSKIILKTGWKYSEYFNSLDKVSIDLASAEQSDLSFNGPFFELAYYF